MIVAASGFSQKWKLTRYEAIVGIGSANFFGDVGGVPPKENWFGLKDISLFTTRPSIYLGARYKIEQDKAVKLNIIFAWFNRKDNPNVNYQSIRNYSFNTFVSEQSVQFEYSFINEDQRKFSFALFNRRGMINNFSKINFYGFAGLGGLLFIPSLKGNSNSSYETIKTTTGYTVVIPVGLGLKLIYNNKYSFGFEFGGRYALSDYLDGLTTKFSSYNDVYYFGIFNVVYRLKTTRKGYPIIFRSY